MADALAPAAFLIASSAAASAMPVAESPPSLVSAPSPSERDAPSAASLLPAGLLHVGHGDEPRHVLVAEKSTQTLLVYRFSGGRAELVEALPCTTGKIPGDKQFEGDLRTPEGVYWFTRRIPGETLPPLYGAGALVMDYPNQFDRMDGKTGSGIWLHGVETDDRVEIANDTRGCVAVRNSDFDRLAPLLRLRETPILVVETIEWAAPAEIRGRAGPIVEMLESWRASWAAGDLEAYLAHHDRDFVADGLDLDGWARRKGAVADRNGPTRIAVDEIIALAEDARAWVRFRQEYASRGHADVGLKELRLRRRGPADDDWAIVGESWWPLDEDFELLDPVPGTPTLSLDQVAALAPDAAPDEAVGEVTPAPDELAELVLRPSLETAPEPDRSDREPPAPVSEEPTRAMQRDAAPEPEAVADPEPATTPAREAGLRAAAAGSFEVRTRLQPASVDRGRYRLLGPHARLHPGGLSVQVQLLSTRPHAWSEGRWHLQARGDDGSRGADTPDASAFSRVSADDGHAFRTRQGELLAVELPRPSGATTQTVVAVVRDDDGRVVLQQEILIQIENREP